jgi:hypothetical protein
MKNTFLFAIQQTIRRVGALDIKRDAPLVHPFVVYSMILQLVLIKYFHHFGGSAIVTVAV